ncbi:helix-turn-helix domain-containing protein [Rhodocytophaga aerolata]|uniref:Helix-turn-helix domain-containing protein n=1 Tax=Rhodocytophaga aerolata TaxID=455078 RepID=A0ABT8RK20_9BACT|nr:helix-turn-helix domain-containing protein [Rhodocytophaga aerolata]MDO1451658.1 helix-turn-helix domain-containing protein [Rhodocytophaga aerolata]
MINAPSDEDFHRLESEIQALHKKLDYLIRQMDKVYHSRDYNTKEAAKELGISPGWLTKLRIAKRIGYINNAGNIRFTQAHIDEYRATYNVPARKSPFL